MRERVVVLRIKKLAFATTLYLLTPYSLPDVLINFVTLTSLTLKSSPLIISKHLVNVAHVHKRPKYS